MSPQARKAMTRTKKRVLAKQASPQSMRYHERYVTMVFPVGLIKVRVLGANKSLPPENCILCTPFSVMEFVFTEFVVQIPEPTGLNRSESVNSLTSSDGGNHQRAVVAVGAFLNKVGSWAADKLSINFKTTTFFFGQSDRDHCRPFMSQIPDKRRVLVLVWNMLNCGVDCRWVRWSGIMLLLLWVC